ncbi:hypothetical protein BJD99_01470 [Rhodococcus sp. 1163]|nr:hypothetical protein BJD99_01470 [Rhodococcus sp. 1163]
MVAAPATRPAVRDAETKLHAEPQDVGTKLHAVLRDVVTRGHAALRVGAERIRLAVQGDLLGNVSLLSSANRM